jgi:hypothetical protein
MEPKAAYEILRSKANLEDNAKRALLDIIKTDPKYASRYAEWASEYAKKYIKGRFPEAEEIIKTNPYYAYRYAKDVIQGRWEEAEDIIKTNPEYACWYAKYVIQGRWPKAEDVIKKDPEWVSYYAINVIGDENFWKNQKLLADFMKSKSEPKTNSELDDLKKQREELDNRIKQLECA